mgnify:CR=1 FL=1
MLNNTYSAQELQQRLYNHYDLHGRHNLPWRLPEHDGTFDPYKIMVSELMLQQTQVPRVIPKFNAFIKQFPTVSSLANANLADVLMAWSGLGYNRRAKYLWHASQAVVSEHGSIMPQTIQELVLLPGVGKNTAGAILVYAFNKSALFIETNVRTVYIHHYFSDVDTVDDHAILRVLTDTIDQNNPRLFYWALMDYGTHLKAEHGNASRRSKQYVKQTPFHGSQRQIRGKILKLLAAQPQTLEQMQQNIIDDRLDTVIAGLIAENLIHESDGRYSLG